MKIRIPEVLFGRDTVSMKEDVLRAVMNLEMANDPNFLKIKQWLAKEHDAIIPQGLYTIGMPADQANGIKGMAVVLGALNVIFQEPKAVLANDAAKKAAAAAIKPVGQGQGA